MKLFREIAALCLAAQAAALTIGGKHMKVERDSAGLQDIVTHDEHSLMVYGERVFVFSGEFHPFRLPVPSLWLDVFQKVKALGFNVISFYVDWALLEGKPGVYSAEGIFAFEPFFDAAKEAGVYLLARPGPYINAEVSGGGFPGWVQRIKGQLRTRAPDFLAATDNYMAGIGAAIAKAQITNGGPVILVQPENEYTNPIAEFKERFPDPVYFAYVKKQLRDAGIIVPFINNDVSPKGYFAPGYSVNGSKEGNVDIYGHDNYPLGFDCANPTTWPANNLPTNFHALHQQQSPSTPYALVEFQAGAFDPWGGPGFEKCSILLNNEFERVFYKNDFASGVAILNLYMIFGGTNWGNLGHPGGYTSYDYGSSIRENREIDREKYSELKLQANFLKVSPAYLTSGVGTGTTRKYTDSSSIFTTPLLGNDSAPNFYIVRHSDYRTTTATTYKLTVTTSKGALTIPQLNGSLTLSGRDSKWHVTDYDLGGTTLLYSSAEIFTWKIFGGKTVLVVYGGPGEQHELAVITDSSAKIVEGADVTTKRINGSTVLNWKTSTTRRVVQVGKTFIYILDRNSAYNYWVPDFVREDKWGAYSANIGNTASVIVEAGYLVRSVYINNKALHIDGDLNATVPIKVLGTPAGLNSLHFNGAKLDYKVDSATGEWSSTLQYSAPKLNLPDLPSLSWKYLDNLPEIKSTYDDSAWTKANQTTTNNFFKLQTPTSLFSSDYGYHAGVLIYRGHFTATGNESSFMIRTQGGSAFGSSVWLDSTYIGSWAGIDKDANYNSIYTLPNLNAGQKYVFTVVIDNNGLDENFYVGGDVMKTPRGIFNYQLAGHAQNDITWKLTGNLGGESYIDKARGPLNEGGLYAERQGFTQPYPPNRNWAAGSPLNGTKEAGIAFYQASFDLDLPDHYDVPLSFSFGNTTINGAVANYRAQLWVNGYQFGKYVNNIGPQTDFAVPEGVLNYHGQNWLAIELWAQQATGAHLTEFALKAGTPVWTSMDRPEMVPRPAYSKRLGAY
ncbi:probable beta-galactosidase [Rhynchosporium agropyri]|uniref:Beta-galactosidase n=1 Tax=Rhynchosporium agropyri TaxID=914238 RepID=A0A1E1JU21_9HELO|nr:probable beta-galactosidase [Rhynchosporium agropyri]